MEWWQAIVGGLVGGVVVALLHIWHERSERIRERKIEAADELVTAAVLALLRVRDAGEAARREGAANESTRDAVHRAGEHRDEVHSRVARVLLLYGAEVEATEAAAAVASWINLAVYSLEQDAAGRAHREAASRARAANVRFSRLARADFSRWVPWRPSRSKAGVGGARQYVGD